MDDVRRGILLRMRMHNVPVQRGCEDILSIGRKVDVRDGRVVVVWGKDLTPQVIGGEQGRQERYPWSTACGPTLSPHTVPQGDAIASKARIP